MRWVGYENGVDIHLLQNPAQAQFSRQTRERNRVPWGSVPLTTWSVCAGSTSCDASSRLRPTHTPTRISGGSRTFQLNRRNSLNLFVIPGATGPRRFVFFLASWSGRERDITRMVSDKLCALVAYVSGGSTGSVVERLPSAPTRPPAPLERVTVEG